MKALQAEPLLLQLQESLADARLSEAEKHALAQALEGSRPGDEIRRRLRNRAFELVRQRLVQGEAGAADLVHWLEGVVKTLDGGGASVARLQTRAYFSPGNACLEAVRQHLRRARRQVDICVFTISDDRISAEILALLERGLPVRLISDNDKTLDSGSDVERLGEAGAQVRLDRTSAHMHHKFALVDGEWLLNGSFNWTRSASDSNEENLVVSNDPELVRQFSARFESLWQQLQESRP